MLKTRQEGGGRGKGTSLARSETLQLRLSSQLLVCGQMLFCYSPQFPTVLTVCERLNFITCQNILIGLKIKYNIRGQ